MKKEGKGLRFWAAGAAAVLCLIAVAACFSVLRHAGEVKYVFLFIGDGMGINQVKAAQEFFGEKMCFQDFPVAGLMDTDNAFGETTDSAAGVTAIATGKRTANGVVSKSADLAVEYPTIMELAKQGGFATGVVTTAPVNHATPAGFYSHEDSRENYDQIADDAIFSGTVDYLAGGRFLYREYDREAQKAKAAAAGFAFLDDMEKIKKTGGEQLELPAILQVKSEYASQYMEYELDRQSLLQEGKTTLCLAELVEKGIEALAPRGGFFMAVESGMIDSACHKGDLASAVWEVKALQDAVETAVRFQEKHPGQTLIVVLADHETGGLTMKHGGDLSLLRNQKASFVRYQKILDEVEHGEKDFFDSIEECFGIGYGSSLYFGAEQLRRMQRMEETGEYEEEPVIGLLAEKAKVSFSTDYHTNQPVAVFASGRKSSLFDGYQDNTEIFEKLGEAMGLTR